MSGIRVIADIGAFVGWLAWWPSSCFGNSIKAGCLVFLVHQLGLPYAEAVECMDRHPCNEMRGLTEWARLSAWLQECSRLGYNVPPEEETYPPHCLNHA